jgi:hypothetical protein
MKIAAHLSKTKIRSIRNFVYDIEAAKYRSKIRAIRIRRSAASLNRRHFS